VSLSDAGQNAVSPQVAVDPAGDAVVAWQRSNGAHTVVQASVRPAGGSFGPAATLSDATQDASQVHVAIDPAGNATVVWSTDTGSGTVVQAAAVRPASGSFGLASSLSDTSLNLNPQLAVDGAGNVTVVWNHLDPSGSMAVETATRSAGGGFGPATPFLPFDAKYNFYPQIAINAAGDRVMTAQASDGGTAGDFVEAWVRPAVGGFVNSATRLSDPSADAGAPGVAIDQAGNATVVWRNTAGSTVTTDVATRSAGASTAFSQPAPLGGAVATAEPEIAIDPAGDATVVWTGVGPHTVADAATRPAGGGFGPATVLSDTSHDASVPQIGVDPAGDAIAVWDLFDGQHFVVQEAGRSAGGVFAAPASLSDASQNALEPQVAFARADAAVAVWSRSDGDHLLAQAAAEVPSAAPGPGTSTPPATVVKVAKLKLAPRTFVLTGRRVGKHCVATTRANGSKPHCTRKLAIGVSYTASGPGTVTLTVQRATSGRLATVRAATVRKVCVAATKRNRKLHRCTRYVAVRGKVTQRAKGGANHFTFDGRLNRRRLGPGTYRFVLTPSVGGRAGTPVLARFVLKP
jgi:hypothetical protein